MRPIETTWCTRWWWLFVIAATIVHPALIQVHEATNHACGPAHGRFGESICAPHGPGSHGPHGLHNPHGPGSHGSHSAHADGADASGPSAMFSSAVHHSELEASGRPVDAPIEASHHCFHCVLCYANAHAGQPALPSFQLDPQPESHLVSRVEGACGPRSSSPHPGAPRAPPFLS